MVISEAEIVYNTKHGVQTIQYHIRYILNLLENDTIITTHIKTQKTHTWSTINLISTERTAFVYVERSGVWRYNRSNASNPIYRWFRDKYRNNATKVLVFNKIRHVKTREAHVILMWLTIKWGWQKNIFVIALFLCNPYVATKLPFMYSVHI